VSCSEQREVEEFPRLAIYSIVDNHDSTRLTTSPEQPQASKPMSVSGSRLRLRFVSIGKQYVCWKPEPGRFDQPAACSSK
jgi:hypothetical protein